MSTSASRDQKIITSVSSFVAYLEKEDDGFAVVYRGISKDSFIPVPKVFRDKGWRPRESQMISEMISQTAEDFLQDKLWLDVLVRAQHNGLPTRLLDVSFNPLVALYFASSDDSSRGAVDRYIFSSSRVKQFDSDAISCASNVSRLTFDEQESLRGIVGKSSGNISGMDVRKFNEMAEVKRLVGFVRMEKPAFERRVVPLDLWRYFLVNPRRNNGRVLAQSGAFLVSGLIQEMRPNRYPDVHHRRYLVPKENKPRILGTLDHMGINRQTLFPELQSAAQYISDRYSRGP